MIRSGLRLIRGVDARQARAISAARTPRPSSLADFARRAGLDPERLRILSDLGALDASSGSEQMRARGGGGR